MYTLCLEIVLNSVTCPGVWLCPKGKVMLKISTLGTNKKTRRIYPKFPLHFNETFRFQRLIVGGIRSVAEVLETEELCIELIQWMDLYSKLGIVLAKFRHRLLEIFQPLVLGEKITTTVDVDLLSSKTDYFPGIISPKMQAKVNLIINPCENQTKDWKCISPQTGNFLYRQRPVCHSNSRHRCHCYYDCISNEKCSMCFLTQAAGKKFEESSSSDRQCKAENKFCSWCDYTMSSCNCFSCWRYHSTFH